MRIKLTMKPILWLGYAGLLAVVVGMTLWPSFARAAPPELPPRYTPTPTVTGTPDLTITPPAGTPGAATSSMLELVVKAPSDVVPLYDWQAMWTVVQWEDTDGSWYDVESWQDVLDTLDETGGRKHWSVPDSLFGRGPFRWLVYDRKGGNLLVTSETYDMPFSGGQTILVEVTLSEPPVPVLLPETGEDVGGHLYLLMMALLLAGGIAFIARRSRDSQSLVR